MSQENRMYERIKTLFSRTRLVTPDSPLQTAAKMPAPRTPAKVRTDRSEETQAQASAEEIHPVTLGFAYDQEKVILLEGASLPSLENAISVPLVVSGKTIGSIQAAGDEAGWTPQEIEIVSAVAAQLSHHLENLRTLEQNEKHTHE